MSEEVERIDRIRRLLEQKLAAAQEEIAILRADNVTLKGLVACLCRAASDHEFHCGQKDGTNSANTLSFLGGLVKKAKEERETLLK